LTKAREGLLTNEGATFLNAAPPPRIQIAFVSSIFFRPRPLRRSAKLDRSDAKATIRRSRAGGQIFAGLGFGAISNLHEFQK
jgi:hypothetical protein